MHSLLNANYKSILDRGLFFHRIDEADASYGYMRLPTDAVNDTTLNKIQQLQDGYFLFNGHITNIEDLCEDFTLSNGSLSSDSRCLAEGFSRYRENFLAHCRGMFAFAYSTNKEVILVRDTIGIKPLYYIDSKDVFGFCSEMKGLYTSGTEEIHEVLPGEIIIFDKLTHKVRKQKYTYKSYKNYKKNDLLVCLLESVVMPTKRYLNQSETSKVGVLMSGGVDSSLLVGMLCKYLTKKEKKRVIGFSIGKIRSSDKQIAKQLAKELQIKIIQVKPYSEKKALMKIPEIVYKVESKFPRVIKVALLQDALAEEIQRQGINIVISGEGADELFYGYERFINGLEDFAIDKMYDYFFNRVFYNTLIQRFERIFAKRQIEGRVPFLDQECIILAKKYSVNEKIAYLSNTTLSKIPLRLLAKELALPSYVYLRKKIKMTEGVTRLKNIESNDGYLEAYTSRKLKRTLGEFIQEQYDNYAYTLLSSDSFLGTEEEAMRQVRLLQRKNYKEKEGYIL